MQIILRRLEWILWPLLIAALLILQTPGLFTLPPFWFEDGNIFFAHFYNNHAFAEIFRKYAGYVSLLPNFLAYLVLFLPTHIVRFAFPCAALILAAGTFSLIVSERFNRIIPSKYLRVFLVLIILIQPLLQHTLYSNIAYSQWNCLLLSCLLLLTPGSSSAARFGIETVIVTLCIWSNPVAVTLLPVIIFNRVTSDKKHIQAGGILLIIALISYLSFGIDFKYQTTKPDILSAINLTIRGLLHKVVGDIFFSELFADQNYLKEIFAAIIIVCTGFTAWQKRKVLNWNFIGTTLYITLATVGFYFISRGAGVSDVSRVVDRYFYISKVIFLILIFHIYCSNLEGNFSRVRSAVFVLVIFGLATLHRQNSEKLVYSPKLVLEGSKIANLFRRLEQEEKDLGSRDNVFQVEARSLWWEIYAAPSMQMVAIQNYAFHDWKNTAGAPDGWQAGHGMVSKSKTDSSGYGNALKLGREASVTQKITIPEVSLAKDLALMVWAKSNSNDSGISLSCKGSNKKKVTKYTLHPGDNKWWNLEARVPISIAAQNKCRVELYNKSNLSTEIVFNKVLLFQIAPIVDTKHPEGRTQYKYK